ncbi:MAG: DUF4038 domain-containing protein [Clostridiaceae bacterium]|nr:DUF4038 domain-containing protein [Clostridiaceae bacterium]
MNSTVEKWGIFELQLCSKINYNNPFTDVKLKACFYNSGCKKVVHGFYDGDGIYKIRFMPEFEGEYSYTVFSNDPDMNNISGTFTVTPPSENNHGPVKATGEHFTYADGTPFFVMGTTAYAWHYRPAEVRERTLRSFSEYGFNKIRMLFFPKHYTGKFNAVDVSYEPPCYPFEGEPKKFDFTRPNPEYFRLFEERVKELGELGIEADVILFHPYDYGHWDIDRMDEEDALLYLGYIINRLSAFRNVWWSLANEYDIGYDEDNPGRLTLGKTHRSWDVIGEYIKANDPYGHPRSCHNISFGWIYPDRPWMTHVSYQHPDTYTLMLELKREYKKPVINDEYQYEGNLPDCWGNSSAELTLLRHWLSVMAGGYATHGECFITDGNTRDIFWSYGGDMIGGSAPCLKFLKEIVMTCPWQEMKRDYINTDGHNYFSLSKGNEFYLLFFKNEMKGKTLWIGFREGSPDGNLYDAVFYDVKNCKVIKSCRINPRTDKIEITGWTAVTMKLAE